MAAKSVDDGLNPHHISVITNLNSDDLVQKKASCPEAEDDSSIKILEHNTLLEGINNLGSCSDNISHVKKEEMDAANVVNEKTSIANLPNGLMALQPNGILFEKSESQPSPPKEHDKRRSHRDYIFGKVIGEGSFSTVFLAKEIISGRRCAMKVCDKRVLRREKKTLYVKREKEALCRLNLKPSPFIIKLYATFQGTYKLYFDLAFASNGDLLNFITKAGHFNEECTRFYAAEVLMALEHLHSLGIIHRDIKPENILLDEQMHIKIADFGSVKLLGNSSEEEKQEPERKNSFVGTAQYVAPEILSDKKHSKSIDLWSFGCTVYQMAEGNPPFTGSNEYLIFQKITKLDYSFPSGFNSTVKDLVEKLLILDPCKRLGSQDSDSEGYPTIRSHLLFENVQWESLHLQFPPSISSSDDKSQIIKPNILDVDDRILEGLEPGLDEKQFSRLLGLDFRDSNGDTTESEAKLERNPANKYDYRNLSPSEAPMVLAELDVWQSHQASDFWHERVFKNVIFRMGMVSKRKGLLARPRMLILTSGPHLFYFDVQKDELKGEIPWTSELCAEGKNFRVFLVHTPGRTYHLEDHERQAGLWCDWIKTIHDIYFPPT